MAYRETDKLEDWPTHDGSKPSPTPDWIAPPDPAIGPVVSASTTAERGATRLPKLDAELRMNVTALGSMAGSVVVGGALLWLLRPHGFATAACVVLPGLLGAVVGYRAITPSYVSTYAGERGLQRSIRKGKRVTTQVVLFERVASIVSRAEAPFAWRRLLDRDGRCLFEIAWAEGGVARPEHAMMAAFARRAEALFEAHRAGRGPAERRAAETNA